MRTWWYGKGPDGDEGGDKCSKPSNKAGKAGGKRDCCVEVKQHSNTNELETAIIEQVDHGDKEHDHRSHVMCP